MFMPSVVMLKDVCFCVIELRYLLVGRVQVSLLVISMILDCTLKLLVGL